MKKVLGLDLGISSIGWGMIAIDKDKKTGKILDAGVHIVPIDTRDADEFSKGNSVSASAERTAKRSLRRNNQRFKLRRQQLLAIMEDIGWIQGGFEWQSDDPLYIYGLRAKAATSIIGREELARVFLALNGKRGYQSNRKAVNDDEEGTEYLERIRERDRELITRDMTIGQKHLELLLVNRWSTLKNRTYSRSSYRAEFDRIWHTQKKAYAEMDDRLYHQIANRTIFYQRPLKSQKGLISKCTLEPSKRVAPKSSPVFQVFKIWQQLHNIRIKDDSGQEQFLDMKTKNRLFEILNSKGKMTTAALKKELKIGRLDPVQFNFEVLEGNYTRSGLDAALEGCGFDTYDLITVDWTLEGNDFDKQPAMMMWHLIYSATDQDSLIKNLQEQYKLPDLVARKVANVRLVNDYGSLSVKAMRRIIPYMMQGHEYDKAAELAGYRHSLHETRDERDSRELQDHIEVLKKNSLRNPTVEKILNQLIHLLNAIIQDPALGRPDEIRIELARELKMNAKKRKDVSKRIAENTRRNEDAAKKLRDEFGLTQISRKDIDKYKLWKEAGMKSLYSGQPISPARLFTTDEYDVDHIIPQSRLFDDSFTNKILCESALNREKGNMTAWEYMASKGEAELRRFQQDIEACKDMPFVKKSKLRMQAADIPDDFINRQLNESQYIVKAALQIARKISTMVTSTTGSVTSTLRNEWGLAHMMQELNHKKYEELDMVTWKETKGGKRIMKIEDWSKRDDHRHHAIDALVVAATSQSIIQRLNTLNARADDPQQKRIREKAFEEPWPAFRSDVKSAVSRILISFKGKNKVTTWNTNRYKKKGKGHYGTQRTQTPRGQLHLETVYGQMKWYDPNLTPLDKRFTNAHLIVDPDVRRFVLAHLQSHEMDSARAFGNLKKNPLIYNGKPLTEVRCWKEQFTIRKAIGPDLKLEKVVDPKIHNILQERLYDFGGDKKKAFSDLENNPIWLNQAKGIEIKSVKVIDNGDLIPLHHNGRKPIDYVYTRNNHHAAVFKGPDGERKLEMVSFMEAVERRRQGFPVYASQNDLGWPLEYALHINDYFIFDLDPNEVNIFDPSNRELISDHLFRVQKLTTTASGGPDFVFRHHLETTLKRETEFAFKRITSFKNLTGFKVKINRLGHIAQIG